MSAITAGAKNEVNVMVDGGGRRWEIPLLPCCIDFHFNSGAFWTAHGFNAHQAVSFFSLKAAAFERVEATMKHLAETIWRNTWYFRMNKVTLVVVLTVRSTLMVTFRFFSQLERTDWG